MRKFKKQQTPAKTTFGLSSLGLDSKKDDKGDRKRATSTLGSSKKFSNNLYGIKKGDV